MRRLYSVGFSLALVMSIACALRADTAQTLDAPPADDPPVTVDSGWNVFTWVSPLGAADLQGPFTFTSSAQTVLTITDYQGYGDRFAVYDNGVLLGQTSASSTSFDGTFEWTPSAALTDSKFSHGAFDLGSGSHSLVFETTQYMGGLSIGVGSGAFRVDSGGAATPLPATAMAGTVLLVVVGTWAKWRPRRVRG